MKKNPFDPEQLSAIIDNEESIEHLEHDQETSQTWARYQLIGAAMRQEVPSHIDTDLSNRMTQYIEKHPSQLNTSQGGKNTLIILKDWLKKKKAYTSFLAQGAIAAGVATFMIHVTQVHEDHNPINQLHTKPFLGQISPVSLQPQPMHHTLSKNLHTSSYNQLKQEEQLLLQEKIKSYVQDYQQQKKLYPSDSQLSQPMSTTP